MAPVTSPPPREDHDLAVGGCAVKAGEYEMFVFIHDGFQTGTRRFPVDGLVVVDPDDIGRIHKREAEVFGHELGAEVFAARYDFHFTHGRKAGVHRVQLFSIGCLRPRVSRISTKRSRISL